ncbi:MAG: hypothetical protein JSW45_05440 [Thiotrichales bacterium]|nr:MAG: hypothetical protein JSW45_05440 [Thiotrichales bacterium]
MKQKILLLFLFVLAGGATIAIFQRAEQPFLWSLLLWTIIAFASVALARSTPAKAVFVNFAAALFVLTAFEGYLWLRQLNADPTRMQGGYTVDYFDADELLGYGPAKDHVVTSEKYYGNDLIYSVQYAIDGNGLRVAPPSKKPVVGCVLFFGGSVTFGEGVEDDQAMPYQVGILTDNRYQIYNFAFHGYGPHQMLVALESGRVDEITECMPSHVIYQAIISHVERAAGRAIWDKQGPRYILNQGGGVKLAGRFNDAAFDPLWKGWLGRWLTYDTLFGRQRTASAEEVRLYAEIINAARMFTKQHYPGSGFHLLIWDNDELASHDQVMEALQAKDLQLHRISDVLPGYLVDKAQFELSIYDHHPAATTHKAIAQYVAQRILGYADDAVSTKDVDQ